MILSYTNAKENNDNNNSTHILWFSLKS